MIHFKTIDSTHTWALAQDSSALPSPVMITADVQTSSTGRRKGTTWIAPKKTSLLVTFVLPNFKSNASHNLAQLLTCSLIAVANSHSILPLFKWPNDILISNKKLGGAMADIGDNAVVISGAMNILTSEDDLEKIDIPATSFLKETGQKYDISQIAKELSGQFSEDLLCFQAKGFSPFANLMNKRLAYKDQVVTIKGPKNFNGVVKEICADGRLKLLCDGKEEIISTGSLHANYLS